MAQRSMTATSRAQLYCPWAYASKSSPWGFAKRVPSMPSSAAFAFMASTNAASRATAPPSCPRASRMRAPAACATALAASLPDAVSTALSASPNDISSPAASPALDSPTAAASGVTTMRSLASRCSAATMAVMIFVSEAIWARSPAARPYQSVPSSSMSAACDASMLG